MGHPKLARYGPLAQTHMQRGRNTRHLQCLVELHGVPKLLRAHAALDDHLVNTFIEWHPHPSKLLIKGKCFADLVQLASPNKLRDKAIRVVITVLGFVVRRGRRFRST